MIAKLPAADETSRATARSLGSYENEVRFYQLLAPELPMRTPAVYYADIDVETASFILLLEDMAPAQQGDQLRGCSPETARGRGRRARPAARAEMGRPDPRSVRVAAPRSAPPSARS